MFCEFVNNAIALILIENLVVHSKVRQYNNQEYLSLFICACTFYEINIIKIKVSG